MLPSKYLLELPTLHKSNLNVSKTVAEAGAVYFVVNMHWGGDCGV